MGQEAKKTTDHDVIRRWTESRGGHPATVRGTGGGADAGLLRIDFPGYGEASHGEGALEEIGWDEFFRKFEDSRLAFVYQEQTSDGRLSRFNKLVRREAP